MKNRVKKLIRETWCSQMVDEHYHTDGLVESRLGYYLSDDDHTRYIADYALTWANTSQGRSYWSEINAAYGDSFRR